ncbi:ornithine cyclodeaminase family protein (plasmid) [Arthrobacter sp. UC242_113]|uniref:ornithine cyclodeaminase family protein n=1 Tax=Arthrobacter sp. UC242_113 TaxID=3374550 RepID=UPI003758454F
MSLRYYDAQAVFSLLTYERAIDAIAGALINAVDPELESPRLFASAPQGEFLLMPAEGAAFCGVKALTVAPQNPLRGLPKIQGLYLLYTASTLEPVAILDGAALTAIRTPAVAFCAVRVLASIARAGHALPASPRVLVFGAGTQALGCLLAARAVLPDARFEVIGRSDAGLSRLRTQTDEHGIDFHDRRSDVETAVATADVIVCATTSTLPLFDGKLVKASAIVAAIGTHGKRAREIDDGLVSRADVIVESRASAERENGNLSSYYSSDDWRTRPPANLRELIRGEVKRRPGRPAVYTGVGMSWEDLVCATAVHSSLNQGGQDLVSER